MSPFQFAFRKSMLSVVCPFFEGLDSSGVWQRGTWRRAVIIAYSDRIRGHTTRASFPTKRLVDLTRMCKRVIRVIRRSIRFEISPDDILIVCHRTASAVPCQIRVGHTSYNCRDYNSPATNGRQEGETRHGEIWGPRSCHGLIGMPAETQ